MTRNGALAGMIVGAVTVVLWKFLSTPPIDPVTEVALSQSEAIIPFALYEIVPGFIFALIAIVVVSLVGKMPSKEVQEEFDSVKTSHI